MDNIEVSEATLFEGDRHNAKDLRGLEKFHNIKHFYLDSIDDASIISNYPNLEYLCIDNWLDSDDPAVTIDINDNPNLVTAYSQGVKEVVSKYHLIQYHYVDGTKDYFLRFRDDTIVICDKDETSNSSSTTSPHMGDVEINSIIFPDDSFRDYISVSFDEDGNGYLSENEIKSVRSIYLFDEEIGSLNGLEKFPLLEDLICSDCNLTSIDVSQNKALKNLYCNGNQLTSLDITNNTVLEELDCSCNELSTLNVTQNKELRILTCYDNKLSSLDVKTNTKLENLDCSINNIKTIEIYSCPNILRAYKSGNKNVGTYSNGIEYVDYVWDGSDYYYFSVNLNDMKVIDAEPTSVPEPTVVAIPTEKPFVTPKVSVTPVAKPTSFATPTNIPKKTPTKAPASDSTSSPTTVPKAILKLDKTNAQLICGEELTLKATLTGSSDMIIWSSSDTKIVTVDSKGNITTKQAGTVTITASAAGKTAICTVTVLYKDVTSAKDFWYAPTNYLTAANVVKGYDKQTKFKPANDCTRAQMVTFLWRLAGEPAPKSTTTKFKDIKSKDYFYKPVLWAVEKGITTGVSKTKFNPQGVCTRAQTVTFLWRMAGKKAPKTTKNKFSDIKKTDYFYKAVLWASEKKIVAGYSDGTFKPQGKCLRRQMVTFLYKYDKYINGRG